MSSVSGMVQGHRLGLERAKFLFWASVALGAIGVLPYLIGQEAPGHQLWNWQNGWDLLTFSIWILAAVAFVASAVLYALEVSRGRGRQGPGEREPLPRDRGD